MVRHDRPMEVRGNAMDLHGTLWQTYGMADPWVVMEKFMVRHHRPMSDMACHKGSWQSHCLSWDAMTDP